MVRVYIAKITPLLIEENYRAYYRKIPAWRQEKADKLRFKEDKARSVGAWILWEKIKKAGQVPQEAVFNLSHSGDYVLCAYCDVAKAQVGCDLEEVKELRLSVARRFFGEREYRHIAETKDPECKTWLFYRYWVLKESFMKATRKGMAMDMRSYEIGWDQGGKPVIARKPEEYADAYYCREYRMQGVHAAMAVCTTDPDIGELQAIEL